MSFTTHFNPLGLAHYMDDNVNCNATSKLIVQLESLPKMVIMDYDEALVVPHMTWLYWRKF